MPSPRLSLALGSALICSVLTVGPAALGAQTPATPAAVACAVAPIASLADVDVEQAQPTAPVSIDGPFTPPSGAAAPEDVVARVTATVAESIACQNDGDVARTLALFTASARDAFFAGPRGFDVADVEATIAAGPVPVDPDRATSLVGVADVVVLDDGTYGATVTTRAGEQRYVDFLTFSEGETSDGTSRLLIAGSVAIDSQTQVEGGATAIP